jgi:hypothetical protein
MMQETKGRGKRPAFLFSGGTPIDLGPAHAFD